MNSSTGLKHQLTASIAILAVLLLFIAPVVSKRLAERHDHISSTHEMSAMHADMSMMHHTMPMADHNMMVDEGFACGYCDLLVHVPLMLWVFIAFIWLMLVISRAPPVPVVVQPLLRRVSGIHRPRAPPAMTNYTVF